MLTVIKTNKTFTRRKYVPRAINRQWGVYDCDQKKTIVRNLTLREAQNYEARSHKHK